mgnify:CR=1 FL=1
MIDELKILGPFLAAAALAVFGVIQTHDVSSLCLGSTNLVMSEKPSALDAFCKRQTHGGDSVSRGRGMMFD